MPHFRRLTFLVYSFALLYIVVSHQNDGVCSKDTCPEAFKYPSDLEWDPASLSEVSGWLKSQTKKEAITFCKDVHSEQDKEPLDEKKTFRLVTKVESCDDASYLLHTSFRGKLGKTGLPEKQGTLESVTGTRTHAGGACIKVEPSIQSISGQFLSGLPNGRCSVLFTNGESSEMYFKDGYVDGKVRQFNSDGQLQIVGVYRQGLPHGPVWIFPWIFEEEGAVLVHYSRGKVDKNFNVLHLDKNSARLGKLVNQTLLENPVTFTVAKSTIFSCSTVPKIENDSSKYGKTGKGTSPFHLPIKVPPKAKHDGQLFVRSSKTIFFNRIAKTGSQAFIALLYRLEKVNNFKVQLEMLQREYLMEPQEIVAEVVRKVVKTTKPTVWVRHYNFVDFEKYDSSFSGWSPDWFNIVRDPIERVVSWFYYWRSAWNIVERKIQYPDEPLPDPTYLRKDFDTCVLENDPECQFSEGANVLEYADHRSQMMAFCGHDMSCASFNSQEVLQRAKANVDKFYPVVGVLENLNQSLAVMEHKLPQIFRGATKMYAESKEVKKFRNRNAFKVPVSEQVMKMVRANFTREIEFYEFCKQRLQKQFLEIY